MRARTASAPSTVQELSSSALHRLFSTRCSTTFSLPVRVPSCPSKAPRATHMATQRCPPRLIDVPQDVLDTRIASLLLPADRQASNGGRACSTHPLPPASKSKRLPDPADCLAGSTSATRAEPCGPPPPLGGSQSCGWPSTRTPMPRRWGRGCGAPKASATAKVLSAQLSLSVRPANLNPHP